MRAIEFKSTILGLILGSALLGVELKHWSLLEFGSDLYQIATVLVTCAALVFLVAYLIMQVKDKRSMLMLALLFVVSLTMINLLLVVVTQSVEDGSIRKQLVESGQALTSIAHSKYAATFNVEGFWVLLERIASLLFALWAASQLVIRRAS